MTTYLTIMFPAPQCCPCGLPHRVLLPHLSPLCLCPHPAHVLRNATSPVLASPFGIFHRPANGSSQWPCTMWQVPSLYPYWATILRMCFRPELGIFPMGTTASHSPGPVHPPLVPSFPAGLKGRQKDSSHSGKPFAAPPPWVWRFLWEDSRGG